MSSRVRIDKSGSGPAGQAQLMRRVLAGEEVGRPPVFFTGGSWVGRLSGFTRDRLLSDAAALAEAQVRVHEMIGQDALLAYFDPLFIPEAYGCPLRFRETGPLVTPISFDEFRRRSPGVDEGRLPVVLEAVSRLSAYAAGRIPVGTLIEGPFTTLSRIVDAQVLLRCTITQPAAVEAALERVHDVLLRFAQAAAAAGAGFLFVADPVTSASVISPRMYRRFALPALQRLAAAVPIPVFLHICGDTSPILPLMAETGAAALSLDQCMDLRGARALVGEDCILAGNVDPVTLALGSPAAVARATQTVLAAGGRRAFVVMPGCGIPPEAPLENVAAMVRVVQEA